MAFLRPIFLGGPAAILEWLGRQGTRAVAALVFIGIAFPASGALLKPYVTEAIFVLLGIAFLRVDSAALKTHLKRPALVIAATAWTSLALPILFGTICIVFGVRDRFPELFLGLMLQGVASPMMAAPALAALMGLDATLVLVTLVASTALIPFTATLFAATFIGSTLALSPLTLGLRLLGILAGSAFVGHFVRRIFGSIVIERQRHKIDGFNILVLFVFVAAVMENVASRFLATPWATILIAILAFIVFAAVLSLTVLVFHASGRARALALGFMASQRNMGLMVAATSGALPDLTWLFFALSQLPIYLSPQVLQPLVRRLIRQSETAPTTADSSTT